MKQNSIHIIVVVFLVSFLWFFFLIFLHQFKSSESIPEFQNKWEITLIKKKKKVKLVHFSCLAVFFQRYIEEKEENNFATSHLWSSIHYIIYVASYCTTWQIFAANSCSMDNRTKPKYFNWIKKKKETKSYFRSTHENEQPLMILKKMVYSVTA